VKRDFLFLGCENGHEWFSHGGCNAGCHDEYCSCSVPVNVCHRCGDCDYGQNEEAEQIKAECAALWGEPARRFSEDALARYRYEDAAPEIPK
jgi:hypothetical protein